MEISYIIISLREFAYNHGNHTQKVARIRSAVETATLRWIPVHRTHVQFHCPLRPRGAHKKGCQRCRSTHKLSMANASALHHKCAMSDAMQTKFAWRNHPLISNIQNLSQVRASEILLGVYIGGLGRHPRVRSRRSYWLAPTSRLRERPSVAPPSPRYPTLWSAGHSTDSTGVWEATSPGSYPQLLLRLHASKQATKGKLVPNVSRAYQAILLFQGQLECTVCKNAAARVRPLHACIAGWCALSAGACNRGRRAAGRCGGARPGGRPA